MKTLAPDNISFIGRHGEYLDSVKQALALMLSSKDYTVSDVNNLKTKFGIGSTLKRKNVDSQIRGLSKKANSTKVSTKRKSVDKLAGSQEKKLKSNLFESSNISRGC